MHRLLLAMTLPVLLWVGCHNPDNFALNSNESPSLDEFFTLSAVGDTTLPADGVSTVELVAQVRDVSQGPVSVLFTTTAGSLRVGPVQRGDSLGIGAALPDSAIVQTNAAGEARTELVSDPEQAVAQVRAQVVGIEPVVEQGLRIHFNDVADQAIVTFVDPPESAFSHGLALVPITVQVAPHLQGNDRQVRFETTAGTFPFSRGDSSLEQVVKADADGFATAHLRSPNEPGEALVRATVLSFHQEQLIAFTPAPTDSVIRFVDAPERVLADGHTNSRFTVWISPLLQSDADRTVEFVTTSGSFVFPDSTFVVSAVSVRADADGLAQAILRSPRTVDEAFVRASVKGFTQESTMQFDWAGPDSIVVGTAGNQLSMAITDQLQIQAELLRTEGLVTENLSVAFAAADSAGNPLQGARFLDVKRTDVVGFVTAVLMFEDTSLYSGRATISVRPMGIDSDVVGRLDLTIR